MKAIFIKLVFESESGIINTWHDIFDKTIEEIINDVKELKGWENGKFTKAYLEFDNNGYYKVHLDLKPLNKLIK
jgi:hypothetical protein